MTLQKKIVLSKSQSEILKRHARENEPNESCAILFGKIKEDCFLTKEIFLTKNIENSRVSFTISNEELLTAYREAERKNLEVVGIFHSHPDSTAYPSDTDKKYMEINPIPWIIFSSVEEDYKAYILESTIIPLTVSVL